MDKENSPEPNRPTAPASPLKSGFFTITLSPTKAKPTKTTKRQAEIPEVGPPSQEPSDTVVYDFGTETLPPDQADNTTADEIPTLLLKKFEETPWINFKCVQVGSKAERSFLVHNCNAFDEELSLTKQPLLSGFKVQLATTGSLHVPANGSATVVALWTPSAIGNARETLQIKGKSGVYRVVLFGTGVATTTFKKVKVNVTTAFKENGVQKLARSAFEMKTPARPGAPASAQPSASRSALPGSSVKASAKKPLNLFPTNALSTSPMAETHSYRNSSPNKSSSKSSNRILHAQRQSTARKASETTESLGKRFEQSSLVPAVLSFSSEPTASTAPIPIPSANEPQQQATASARDPPKALNRLAAKALEFRQGKPTINLPANKDGFRVQASEPPAIAPANTRPKRPSPNGKLQEETDSKRRKVVFSREDSKQKPKASAALPTATAKAAASNSAFDPRWMEKEEVAFSKWLNWTLVPNSLNLAPTTLSIDEDDGDAGLQLLASSKGKAAALADRNKASENDKTAASARVAHILVLNKQLIFRIEQEVDEKRLAIRDDKHLWADVGIRQNIVNLLTCYNPFYLKYALETLFHTTIELPAAGSPSVKLGQFVARNLLFNSAIAAKHEGHIMRHYGPGFKPELDAYIMKKFFILVWLLEQIKVRSLFPEQTCLFHKNSVIKSSQEIAITFCKEYMAGEGDIIRHLSFIGYQLLYEQSFLEEFDYRIATLSNDLRDGVRLAKLADVIANRTRPMPSLSQHLRVPAVSRLQKIHNVNVALIKLAAVGIQIPEVSSRDIVDGHRGKTLALIWKVIASAELSRILPLEVLLKEIERLRSQNWAAKIVAQKLDLALTVALFNSELLGALLEWVQLVCARFGLAVNSFSAPFSDGKAFCYLISYYCPEALPADQIRSTQRDLAAQSEAERNKDSAILNKAVDGNWVGVFSPPAGISIALKKAIEGEKFNFVLVKEAVKKLGQTPYLVRSFDMSNTLPDEKVVITFLSYLCSRLLSIQRERKAASMIQRTWRKWYKVNVLAKREAAALVVQRLMRGFLARAAVELKQKQIKATPIIANAIFCYISRQKFLAQRRAAIRIQSWWRMVRQRNSFHQTKAAAVKIQAQARAVIESRRYKKLNVAVLSAQAHIRGWLARKQFQQMTAAIKIQAWWRMVVQRRQFTRLRTSALQIQATIRMVQARRRYTQQRAGVIRIQALARGVLARRQFACALAALKIQAWWKKIQARRQFETMKAAALVIQSWWRMIQCRREFEQQKSAAATIQAWWKGMRQQRAYKRQRRQIVAVQALARGVLARRQAKRESAARKIQAWWRQATARRQYLTLLDAAITVQKLFRGRKDRAKVQRIRAAIKIQAWWRMKQARKSFTALRASSVVIQATVRRHQAQKSFHRVKSAAIGLQYYWRKALTEKQRRLENRSALRIQTWWRMVQQRRKFFTLKHAAVTIQAHWRGYSQQRAYETAQRRVVTLQSLVRGAVARGQFQATKSAALVIQALYRGKRDRQIALRERAARTIQSWWRMVRQEKKYRQARTAIISAQSKIRQYLATRRYQAQKIAAFVIQKHWRGHAARKEFLTQRKAAISIQAWWRMVSARRLFQKKKSAAVKIQTLWRSIRAKRAYQEARAKIIVVQAVARGVLARRQARRERAAVVIQSWWRQVRARRAFGRLKSAVQTIQRVWRGRQDRAKVQRIRAAIRIQAWWRMVQQRRKFNTIRSAAICIQKTARKWQATRKFKQSVASVVKIQSVWRSALAVRQMTRWRQAATRIQAWWRMKVQNRQYRQMLNAALLIQSTWRMVRQRKVYQQVRGLIIKAQALLRRNQAQHAFQTTKQGAITIQAFARGFFARRLVSRIRSATTIQAWWRMVTQRRRFNEMKSAAVKIQSVVRMHQAQKNYSASLKSIVRVQALARGVLARRQAQRERAAVVIQAWWRGIRARRSFTKLRRAAVTIQRIWRGRQDRILVERILAAVKIQSWWRMICARREYKAKKVAAVKIQSWWRMVRQRRTYQTQRKAAIRIQSWWRMAIKRRAYHTARRCIVAMQACSQAYLARRQAQRHRAATRIQAWWKAVRARRAFKQQKQAVVQIERYYQCYRARKAFLQAREAALKIQSWYKYHRAIKHLHSFKRGVVALQAACRGRLAKAAFAQAKQSHYDRTVVTLQSAFRGFIARSQAKHREVAATKIQAAARGCLARLATRGTIAEARKRIAEAARQVKEAQTLRTRTRIALETLLRGQRLVELRAACVVLDVSTKYSEACAQQCIDMNALPVILSILEELNRSEPHIVLLRATLGVLQNLCNFKFIAVQIATKYTAVLSKMVEIMLKCKDSSPDALKQAVNIIATITTAVSSAPRGSPRGLRSQALALAELRQSSLLLIREFFALVEKDKKIEQTLKHLQQKLESEKKMAMPKSKTPPSKTSTDAFQKLYALAKSFRESAVNPTVPVAAASAPPPGTAKMVPTSQAPIAATGNNSGAATTAPRHRQSTAQATGHVTVRKNGTTR